LLIHQSLDTAITWSLTTKFFYQTTALLLLVVAVPSLTALSPFRSLTHFKLFGLAVSLALYVHLPGLPLTATMVRLVVPLRSRVMALLSPFFTFEVHVAVMLPDCLDSHVYVSMVTVSAKVGLILTVTVALLVFVVSVLEVTVSSKVKDVSVVTLGATNEALGLLALVILMAGEEGVVLAQLKFRSVSLRPSAVLEPRSVTSVPTRRADAKLAIEAIGAVCGADGSSGLGVGDGVGVASGFGMSAGLQVLDGCGGVGPGNGDRGPYCLPSRKSP
jgi:hypothetical protein